MKMLLRTALGCPCRKMGSPRCSLQKSWPEKIYREKHYLTACQKPTVQKRFAN